MLTAMGTVGELPAVGTADHACQHEQICTTSDDSQDPLEMLLSGSRDAADLAAKPNLQDMSDYEAYAFADVTVDRVWHKRSAVIERVDHLLQHVAFESNTNT